MYDEMRWGRAVQQLVETVPWTGVERTGRALSGRCIPMHWRWGMRDDVLLRDSNHCVAHRLVVNNDPLNIVCGLRYPSMEFLRKYKTSIPYSMGPSTWWYLFSSIPVSSAFNITLIEGVLVCHPHWGKLYIVLFYWRQSLCVIELMNSWLFKYRGGPS